MAISKVLINSISATGTADSTTYLRGDGTWSTVSSGTDYGSIGSYVLAGSTAGSTTAGSTYAGSTLVRQTSSPAGNGIGGYLYVQMASNTNLGLTGTWRCMTTSASAAPNYYGLDLFVRIS